MQNNDDNDNAQKKELMKKREMFENHIVYQTGFLFRSITKNYNKSRHNVELSPETYLDMMESIADANNSILGEEEGRCECGEFHGDLDDDDEDEIEHLTCPDCQNKMNTTLEKLDFKSKDSE